MDTDLTSLPMMLWSRHVKGVGGTAGLLSLISSVSDGLVHCKSKRDAYDLLERLNKRFNECKLELHKEKTKVIYCNNSRYPIKHPHKEFDFLGFTFRDRWIMNPTTKTLFLGFNPELSKTSLKSIRAHTRKLNIRNRTDLSLNEIARFFNPILRGWIEYYGLFNKHSLGAVTRHVNLTLIAWRMRKHKHLVVSAPFV